MNALILHPMVPRERLAEERDIGRAEGWSAAQDESDRDLADEGIGAACWALREIQSADARTLAGRILLVAVQALEPDAAAALVAEVATLPEPRALVLAILRLARSVL